MQFDLLIRNGTLVDGSGNPPHTGDVGICGQHIADIGDLSRAEAKQTIDAAGRVVAPGFIDAHTHSDTFILVEPFAPSKLTQGVTTEICGQCGGSAAPKLNGARLPSDWEALTYPRPWSTVAEYRAAFEAARPATNIRLFAGHNTIRKGILGDAPRAATADEVRAMCRCLEQALDEGACGLSTGLIYHPGVHAEPEEVLALAKATSRHDGIYATHMRSEGDHLLEAIDEVLAIAEQAGMQVQISHLKTAGKKNWHKLDAVLTKINAARATGLNIYADRYPFLAAGTDLDVLLPGWASAGGRDAILRNLADATARARIIDELNASDQDWNAVMIGGTWSDATHPYRGKSIAEIQDGRTPGAIVADIIEADQTRTGAFFFGMCEENLNRILQEPWVIPGSDASLRAPTGPLAADHPHPRAYGTMPEFFKRLRRTLPLEHAIARMTALPAQTFRLAKRGILQPNNFADIIIFDPATFTSTATYAEPHQFASGMEHVIVNGGHVYSQGRFLDNRKGQFI